MTTDQIIDELIAREGGFTNDPVDPGGPTKYGITAGTLGEWRGLHRAATPAEVASLTRAEAKDIYIKTYIEAPGFNAILNERLRVALIDDGVNSGTAAAIRRLQRVLGVSVDGVLGPMTLAAANAITSDWVLTELVKARCLHYARIVQQDASQRRFIVGWLTRALSFLEVTH
jgi:lysozyme family protein